MAKDFDTTHWSLVLAAARSQEHGARDALGELCRIYWSPLYVFARRRGHAPEQAEDLTQGFFAQLIEKRTLRSARRERGRFRSFLLVCFKHFLADEHDRAHAAKRGGGTQFVSLDTDRVEAQLRTALADSLTPEALFDRRWALVVLESALEDVRLDYFASGAERVFDALRGTLAGGAGKPYSVLAEKLGMSEGAVKVAAHRLRRRFGLALRAHVARTVGPGDVDDEIRQLLRVLSDQGEGL